MNAVAPCGCALAHMEHSGVGAREETRGNAMNRRTLLLGLLGGFAAAPAIIAAALSVEAAPLPEVRPPTPEPLPEPASALTEADLGNVKTDWSQYWRRRERRFDRRFFRRERRFDRRFFRRERRFDRRFDRRF